MRLFRVRVPEVRTQKWATKSESVVVLGQLIALGTLRYNGTLIYCVAKLDHPSYNRMSHYYLHHVERHDKPSLLEIADEGLK